MRIGAGLLLIAVGATLRFGISTVSTHGIAIHTIGDILMLVGLLGVVLWLVVWAPWRRRQRPAYRDDAPVYREERARLRERRAGIPGGAGLPRGKGGLPGGRPDRRGASGEVLLRPLPGRIPTLTRGSGEGPGHGNP